MPTNCKLCGRELRQVDAVSGEVQEYDGGVACSACYYDALSDLLESSPIRSLGRRGVS